MFGTCGSLKDKIMNGNVLIITKAISEEGTSFTYPNSKIIASSDSQLTKKLFNSAKEDNLEPIRGMVWTTDGFFTETREKVKKYSSKGAVAVEMELSALFNVAKYKKIEIASMQIISDELFNPKWVSIATKKTSIFFAGDPFFSLKELLLL